MPATSSTKPTRFASRRRNSGRAGGGRRPEQRPRVAVCHVVVHQRHEEDERDERIGAEKPLFPQPRDQPGPDRPARRQHVARREEQPEDDDDEGGVVHWIVPMCLIPDRGAAARRLSCERRRLSSIRRCLRSGARACRHSRFHDHRRPAARARRAVAARLRGSARAYGTGCASMTITPRFVARAPASSISRARHVLGQATPSRAHRSEAGPQVATLLTFCPPGPGERTKSSFTSSSARLIRSLTKIAIVSRPLSEHTAAAASRASKGRIP